MGEDKRKNYWNEKYVEYWKSRVGESNLDHQQASQLNAKDVMTATDQAYEYAVDQLIIQPNDKVLEMGCGFGRSIPFIYKRSQHITAIDISEAMIREAKEKFQSLNGVEFIVTEAETLPFATGTFDKVICFSVFDALYQKKALIEINRIMKVSGLVLVTGKNDHYHVEDEKAYVAEVNARKKEHPNHFTDVKTLIKNIDLFGFKIRKSLFFEKRGDTATNEFALQAPERFYEYTLVLEKTSEASADAAPEIASDYSKTFREKTK